MRRTKDDADQTRQDLLEAALDIFSRKGYQAARLEDVAQAAGVTRGAIYHHFGGKNELYMALIEHAAALGNTVIERAVEEGGTFLEIIRRVVVDALSLLEEDPRFSKVMALSLATPEMAELTRRRRAEAQTLVENISGFFRLGIEGGELRPDLEPQTAARALLGYQNGLVMLWLANRQAFSIRETAPALAEIFVRGIVAG